MVLSGGGAGGVAHIGVLKALEEYGIPIDYITGTSMGGLVGALYAAGYSPKEIEQLFISDEFKNWAQGNLDSKYIYYLREKDENASLITFKLSTKSIWEASLPTNLISPNAINYGLMEYLAPATAYAKNNFDSLFVPFRCVASDIISKKQVVMKNGDLSTAVRASMAYPFYLSPVTYKDKLLFDGGLYNNFPSDIMYNDFMPDFIIGSNVSSNFPIPKEDNVVSQIKTIIADNTAYSIPCENSIIIKPDATAYSTFDFDNNEQLIQIGYDATVAQITQLYKNIKRRVDVTVLAKKRAKFRSHLSPLIFDKVIATGLKKSQNYYINKSLRIKKDTISAKKLQSEYIKISSDDKIKSIYPEAVHNDSNNYFTLKLNAKKGKDLFVSFGGVFSSRPINEGFIGLQYNLLSKTALSLIANSYFGKLHNSVNAGFRFDFPFQIPFYWKTTFTVDGWDYFRSKSTFFEDTKPAYLLLNDNYFKTEIGLPVAYKGKVIIEGTVGEIVDKYYQTKQFLSTDTTDKTEFRNFSTLVQFERNSLDRKQYASKGSFLSFGVRYVNGQEQTIPGSTSIIKDKFEASMKWMQLKLKFDKYFNDRGKIKFGVYGEGVYANQPFFNNYSATILLAPAFEPLPESKTLFQENFRAHAYLAGGIKTIYNVFNNFQLRFEGYVFQPHKQILKNTENKAIYGKAWATRDYILATSAVYHTPIGPIAVDLNYYDKTENHWSFLFHFGYIIFNKKSLE